MCEFCPYNNQTISGVDTRWIQASPDCPDDKVAWFDEVSFYNDLDRHAHNTYPPQLRKSAEELIVLADIARFAMLKAYGLQDLYFEQNRGKKIGFLLGRFWKKVNPMSK